jgi:hypothetical protein
MIDLDRRLRAIRLDHVNDLAHAFDLTILPEPGIAIGNTPLARDRRLFDKHKSCPAHRKLAVVNQMERRDVAVLGRVHSHRRDHDAVVQLDTAENSFFKQLDHLVPPPGQRA